MELSIKKRDVGSFILNPNGELLGEIIHVTPFVTWIQEREYDPIIRLVKPPVFIITKEKPDPGAWVKGEDIFQINPREWLLIHQDRVQWGVFYRKIDLIMALAGDLEPATGWRGPDHVYDKRELRKFLKGNIICSDKLVWRRNEVNLLFKRKKPL